MVLPCFYLAASDPAQTQITLEEDVSRHLVQVLRMEAGELLQLTDGRGNLLTAQIISAHKKHTLVKLVGSVHKPADGRKISVAISLLKNTDRFEWFLEKATEIGVSEIIPFISQRTEKKQFRYERLKAVLVSALIQSQGIWLPDFQEPRSFDEVLLSSLHEQKFIAHCQGGNKSFLPDTLKGAVGSRIILVGPEGDFTAEEIDRALASRFIAVNLGETRLRSETAAVVAASLLKML
jgi:16S rRNA (uracil1498-N3)-methyltransferase